MLRRYVLVVNPLLPGWLWIIQAVPLPGILIIHSLTAVGSPEWFSGVVYGSQHMARPAIKLLSLVVFEFLLEFCGLTPERLEPSQVSQENLRCGEGISDLV